MSTKDTESIREDLNKSFSKGFYKFEDTHFVTGRQIHSEHFFYVRDYLQKTDNVNQIVEHLAQRLTGQNFSLINTTFFSTGIYSELLLLKLIEKLDAKKHGINFAILDTAQEEPSLHFKPYPIHDNVILLLPVSCTCSSISRIDKLIKRLNPAVKPDYNVISIFIILHQELKRHLESTTSVQLEFSEQGNLSKKVIDLYNRLGWKTCGRNRIKFLNDFECHYIIPLYTDLFPAESCPLCFPEEKNEVLTEDDLLTVDYNAEQPVFPTWSNRDTPDLIFRPPSFSNNYGSIHTDDFKSVLNPDNMLGENKVCHLFGHLKIESNSYLHYIIREKFYSINEGAIRAFFTNKLKELFAKDTVDEIMVVTQPHHKGSQLFHDIFSDTFFAPVKLTFVYISPRDEFMENFLVDYSRKKNRGQKIIYFDFIISAGKNFKIISDYLRFEQSNDKRGFDALLSVIDRTTVFSKIEILKKLDENPTENNKENTVSKFLAFFKLNVPLLDAFSKSNFVQQWMDRLSDILSDSHLDSLKMRILGDIAKGEPRTLSELEEMNKKVPPENRRKNLFKLQVLHEISNYIDNSKGKETDTWQINVEDLINTISRNVKLHEESESLNRREVEDLVIKSLAFPICSYYKGIYMPTFKYIVNRTLKIIDEISSNNYLASIEVINRLEFYIKRSVIVKSNFILSQKFLYFLKHFFEKVNTVSLNKYFLLKCYKYLLFKNPSLSITLEGIVNKTLPDCFINTNMPITDTIKDQFYYISRIIKTENIQVLNDFKNYFTKISENKTKKEADEIRRSFFSLQDNSLIPSPVQNLKTFLKKSKHNHNRAEMLMIEDSISAMLETVYLLNNKITDKRSNVIKYIKSILNAAVKIFGEDSNLGYAFCMKYADNTYGSPEENMKYAPNIFSILSNSERTNIKLSDKGLVYQMLEGIYSEDESTLSTKHSKQDWETILAVVRNESDEFISFNQNFVSPMPDAAGRKVKIPTDLIKKDFKAGEHGVIEEGANIILLFRLAELDNEKKENLKGRGVFVLYSKREPTTKNFIEILNTEKVRLLVLIKEEIISYLNKLIGSNTFFEIIQKSREIELKQSMEHGIKSYFSALNEITMDAERDTGDMQFTKANEKFRYIKFLQNKIHVHFNARTNIGNVEKDLSYGYYRNTDISETFSIIMYLPYLSAEKFSEGDFILHTNEITTYCRSVIFDQVVPELMINMRKYSNGCDKPRLFSITQNGNYLVFENPLFMGLFEDPDKNYKKDGGLEMCNNILEGLGLKKLSFKLISNNKIRWYLNFK